MEVRFKREMNHNYMIIDAPESAGGYECRMLAGNTIEGLLKFRVRHYEEKKEFYYEITSRQPLSRLLEQRKAAGEEIRGLLLAVLGVLGRIEEFLLKEEALLLDPDYIYVEPDSFTAELCLLPGHCGDLPAALSGLLKFLLERVDHQDKEGVVLAYNLYQESLKENYGAGDLLRRLLPENDRIFLEKQGQAERESEEVRRDAFPWQRENRGMDGGVGKYEEKRYEEKRYGEKRYGEQGYGEKRYEEGDEEQGYKGQRHEGQRDEEQGYERTTYDAEKNRKKKREKHILGGVKHSSRKNGGRSHVGLGQAKEGRGARIGNGWVRCLAAAAGAEALIWYILGEDGLRQYGAWSAAVFIVIGLLLPSGKQKGKEEKRQAKREKGKGPVRQSWEAPERMWEEPTERKGEDPEEGYTGDPAGGGAGKTDVYSWEIRPESQEEYQKQVRRDEEERIERSREEGTVLLTALGKTGSLAVLESLSRDTEAVEIAYVPFVIGKHRELADHCLDRPAVSRLHLRVDRKEGVFIATDLNSTNGTAVNGYQLQANETVSIKTGDLIFLADIGFRFSENNIL